MLPGDLVRAKVSGDRIAASYVSADKPAIREIADDVLLCFATAVEERWRRAELEAALAEAIGDAREHKIAKGFAKLLFDRATFETGTSLEPADVRRRLFRAAREAGGVSLERGPWSRPLAEDLLARVAADLGVPPSEVSAAMYADRKDEERIVALPEIDVPRLVARYNVALVQALLLHASEVRIELDAPTVPRLRQLMRWVKFHQILFAAEKKGSKLTLVLDGPLSLFSQSTRYGLNLASFFPALLLQDRWNMSATVLWTRAQLRKRLEIGPEDGLETSRRDDGAYETREQKHFLERFQANPGPWRITDGDVPLDLGGRGVLLPDFTFTDGERVGHLEIVGFWRKEWLARRIDLLRRFGPPNLVLAVSRKLKVDADALDLPQEVVEFGEIVPPRPVLAALDRVAVRPS